MKQHDWIIEEVDGGHVGIGHFWICVECKASGGPVFGNRTMFPFFADGSGLKVGYDCVIAKKLIEAHTKGTK